MAVALSSTSLIAAVNVDENGVGFVGKGDVQQSYAAHHAPDPIVSTSNYIIGPSEIYAAIALGISRATLYRKLAKSSHEPYSE